MRADQRSDIFSLGAVLFEILTGERLFTGDTTADVLERVVAGDHPEGRLDHPAVPEAVEAILARALERQAAVLRLRRGMGEACEHFLYDKGYGPTNLTLSTTWRRSSGAAWRTSPPTTRDRTNRRSSLA